MPCFECNENHKHYKIITLTIFQKRNKTFCLTILCYYLQTPINGALFQMLLLKKAIACHASMHTEITYHYNIEALWTELSTYSLLQLKKTHKISSFYDHWTFPLIKE